MNTNEVTIKAVEQRIRTILANIANGTATEHHRRMLPGQQDRLARLTR